MPRRLSPASPVDLAAALAGYDGGSRERDVLLLLVKHHLALLQERAPGNSVEVRVPPYAAVQVVPGVRHTRGTPPAVVEMTAETWIDLATGRAAWADAIEAGAVRASGKRTDLTAFLPLDGD